METFMSELSRVGCKQMAVEKRGIFSPGAKQVWREDNEIVWPAWRHAAAKAGSALRTELNIADEMNHLRLFNAMWHDLRAERPELFTKEVLNDCREIMREAALMEITWGQHIIEGGILGLTNDIVEAHVKYLANTYANAVGLGTIFEEVTKDPLAWCESYLKEHGIETNFFENHVLDYDDEPLAW